MLADDRWRVGRNSHTTLPLQVCGVPTAPCKTSPSLSMDVSVPRHHPFEARSTQTPRVVQCFLHLALFLVCFRVDVVASEDPFPWLVVSQHSQLLRLPESEQENPVAPKT